MSNIFDYPRFSTFVSSIVDRKLRTISSSIISSTGYFRQLIADAAASAKASKDSATASETSAVNSTNVWYSFTSLYLGVGAADPLRSSLNRDITAGAFRVRAGDRRLRVVTGFNNGLPVWEDAQVRADYDTVVEAGNNVFLFLNKPDEAQRVRGAVEFQKTVLVPDVTDWNSDHTANASSVLGLLRTHVPAGTITLYFGDGAPVGWGICNGAQYERLDGQGKIQSPDLRGRVAVGVSDGHAFGTAFGSETVTPTINNSSAGITLNVVTDNNYAGGGSQVAVAGGRNGTPPSITDPGHSHTANAMSVVQPSLALHYIMKL